MSVLKLRFAFLNHCVKLKSVSNTSTHFFTSRPLSSSSVKLCPLSPEVVPPPHKIQRPRRALLYVPGHDERKINKLQTLDVDCVALDCEDGVSLDKKEDARNTIHKLYEETTSTFHGELCVRVNSPSSGFCESDIENIFSMSTLPPTVIVPKIDSIQDITWFCEMMNEKSRTILGRPTKRLFNVIFMTESSKGLINLQKIIEAGISACSPRFSCCHIAGIIFGSDDFCANLGIMRSKDASELIYARQKIVATCKAFGLQAIDMVYIDFNDNDGLEKQSLEGARMGFTGKQVIHPNQIPIVQKSFTPSDELLKWAEDLTEAFENSTEGAFTFRGQMIDLPTVLQAKNIKLFSDFIKTKLN